jgi:ubiquinone/menaquinone biosynthesis C-methylase UbiE
MVDVQDAEPVATVRDETALDIFRHQWELYRKFLDHDYLSNAGAYAELHRFLLQDIARPFAFLDLACGDASGIVTALQGTEIVHYRGIDLAPPALALARANLAALACEVMLEEADFFVAMRERTRLADIVWISLSLHHLATPDKCTLMGEVRGGLGAGGALLIYEPTRRDGEDRAAYLDRFEDIGRRDWTDLSADELKEAMKHVRTCDLPETVHDWTALGREAGFARIAELYRSPDDLFRLFSYRV